MAKKNKNLESEPQTIEELKVQNRSLKQTIGGLKTASEGFKKRIDKLTCDLMSKDIEIKGLKRRLEEAERMYDEVVDEVMEFNAMPWYKKMLYHFD